jgi:hypothetical protein
VLWSLHSECPNFGYQYWYALEGIVIVCFNCIFQWYLPLVKPGSWCTVKFVIYMYLVLMLIKPLNHSITVVLIRTVTDQFFYIYMYLLWMFSLLTMLSLCACSSARLDMFPSVPTCIHFPQLMVFSNLNLCLIVIRMAKLQ